MPRKVYRKLVRDRIPEIIAAKGERAVTHVAAEAEYWEKLLEKLAEEVKEFAESASEEEFVDILEVLSAIGDYKKFDREKLEAKRKEKAAKRGGFTKRIVLDETN